VLQSSKTLLVLTPDYLASEWTEFENILAQTLDPAARKRRLLPLILKPCDLPLRIRTLTPLDFMRPQIIVALLTRPLPVSPPPTASIETRIVQAMPTPMTTIAPTPTPTPTSTQTPTSAPTGTATPVNKSTPVPPTAKPPSTETPPTHPPTRPPTEEPTQEPPPTSVPPTSPPETSPTPEPTETPNPPTATPQPPESPSLSIFHKFVGHPQTCIEKEFPENAKTEGWEEGPCP